MDDVEERKAAAQVMAKGLRLGYIGESEPLLFGHRALSIFLLTGLQMRWCEQRLQVRSQVMSRQLIRIANY